VAYYVVFGGRLLCLCGVLRLSRLDVAGSVSICVRNRMRTVSVKVVLQLLAFWYRPLCGLYLPSKDFSISSEKYFELADATIPIFCNWLLQLILSL
jgi:hypothetical protein